MIDRLEYKKRALLLRKQGLSYKEIQSFIPVSKGVLSTWFKGVTLTFVEQRFLENRMAEKKQRGRMETLISNKSRRLERDQKLIREAEAEFQKHSSQNEFLFGIIVYWVKGAQEGGVYQIMSTDTDLISLLFAWMEKYLKVTKETIGVRIFAHSQKEFEIYREFWSKRLDLSPQLIKKTLYKASKREFKAHPEYKGCIRLTLGRVRYVRLMKAWQKLAIEYYGKALLQGI